jgi:hypothetical protein
VDTRLSQRRPRFELGRGIVAERGVSAQPIVEHFNVLKDVLCRLVLCPVLPMVYEQLTLECPEEALHTGVVPAVPSPRHDEQPLVATGRLLVAAIRVVQEPDQWAPVRQRHGEGLLGQLHGQPWPIAQPITRCEYRSRITVR